MKSILQLLFAILIASSSAFFILAENAEVVEAVVCPPGEFPHLKSDYTTVCKDPVVGTDNSEEKVNEIKTYVMKFLKSVIVVSTAFTALVITYAGYLYIISGGNAMKTEQAKQMLFRAGIGTLVLSLSFVIMNFLKVAVGI